MPITAKVIMLGANCLYAFGNRPKLKRSNPYVPIFSRTPARITEPAVGASVCASGSQVWNGNIGTLMAKPIKNARNSRMTYFNPQTLPIESALFHAAHHRDAGAGDIGEGEGVGARLPVVVEVDEQDAEQQQHGADQRVEEELD